MNPHGLEPFERLSDRIPNRDGLRSDFSKIVTEDELPQVRNRRTVRLLAEQPVHPLAEQVEHDIIQLQLEAIEKSERRPRNVGDDELFAGLNERGASDRRPEGDDHGGKTDENGCSN